MVSMASSWIFFDILSVSVTSLFMIDTIYYIKLRVCTKIGICMLVTYPNNMA